MKKQVLIIVAVVALVIVGVFALTACAPASKPADAKAALDKNGYTTVQTTGYVSGVIAALAGEESQIEGTVTGTKTVEDKDGNKKTEYITIVYYKTAKAASEAWEDAKEDAEKDKKDNSDSDWVVGKSGKLIYWGTKTAVKDAR